MVVSTDAHATAGMGVMRCGILQARRAGLGAADVVNTLPWPAFRALLAAGKRPGQSADRTQRNPM